MKRPRAVDEAAGGAPRRLSKSLFDALTALVDDVGGRDRGAHMAPIVDPLLVAWRNIATLHANDLDLDTGLTLLDVLGASDETITRVLCSAEARGAISSELLARLQLAGVYHVRALLECGHRRVIKQVARDLLTSKMSDDLFRVWIEALCSSAATPPHVLVEATVRALLAQSRFVLVLPLLAHDAVRAMNLCAALLRHLVVDEGAAMSDGGGDAAGRDAVHRALLFFFSSHGVSALDSLQQTVMRADCARVRHADAAAFFAAASDSGGIDMAATLAEWLQTALREAHTAMLSNCIASAMIVLVPHAVPWLQAELSRAPSSALAPAAAWESPHSDTICAALKWLCVERPPTAAFPQQCYAMVAALSRDGTLHGPALEALSGELRVRARNAGATLGAADHVRDAVAQFERDGFVVPQSLIMYASRHPSRWRAEFLPALLAPMAREAAYFSLPLDQRDARDRLIGAIQMNRALHLSKARVEEYQQSCHELGTTGVLISASQATAADVFVAELRRQWSSSRAVAAHLAGWNALPSDGDREQVVALIAQLVLDTGAVSNETLSAVLALSPQVADAVVLTVCGYLRDATRELTAAQVRHLASVCVRVDAERANTIARDAWFESCKLSSTFDWIFAARAWLLYTQLMGAAALREPLIVTWLYCLHRRVSAALVQQPHLEGLAEAGRHLRRLWESSVGRVALTQSALTLRDWLSFEAAHPVDERSLDAFEYYEACAAVAQWPGSAADPVAALVSALATVASCSGSVSPALAVVLRAQLQQRCHAEPVSLASLLARNIDARATTRIALPLVVLLPLTPQPVPHAPLSQFLALHVRNRVDWCESPALLRTVLHTLAGNAATADAFVASVPLMGVALHRHRVALRHCISSTFTPERVVRVDAVANACEMWIETGDVAALCDAAAMPGENAYIVGQCMCDELLHRVESGDISVAHAMQCVGMLMGAQPASMSVAIGSLCETLVRIVDNRDSAAAMFGLAVTRQLLELCVAACGALLRGVPSVALAVFAAYHPALSKTWPDRAMVAALRAGGDSCFDVLRARKPSFFALFAAFGGGGAPDGLAGVSRDDALSFVEVAITLRADMIRASLATTGDDVRDSILAMAPALHNDSYALIEAVVTAHGLGDSTELVRRVGKLLDKRLRALFRVK